MLIVGSRALALHCQVRGIVYRQPADLDLFCTREEMFAFCRKNKIPCMPLLGLSGLTPGEMPVSGHAVSYNVPIFKHIEFHIAENSPAITAYLALPYDTALDVYGESIPVASAEVLYSIKRSHRYLPRHWEKHIRDYHLLKNFVQGFDIYPEITKMKQAETKQIKTPSLNQTKEKFFDDEVSNRTFVHDEIHAVMAHRELPMFEYIKDDTNTVKCSKEKFLALPQYDQTLCVLEEAYVIALERAIIPMLYEGKKLADARSALRWALMRICTTLTSGWFREFAVENYPNIWANRNEKYVVNFLKAVDNGGIVPIQFKSEVNMGKNTS